MYYITGTFKRNWHAHCKMGKTKQKAHRTLHRKQKTAQHEQNLNFGVFMWSDRVNRYCSTSANHHVANVKYNLVENSQLSQRCSNLKLVDHVLVNKITACVKF